MAPRVHRAALAALLGAACDGLPPAQGPGNDLLEAVQAADYRSWARPPKGDAMNPLTPGKSTHGDFIDVYLNETLAAALSAAPKSLGAWPEGSIAVLDGWDDPEGSSLRFIAIMERRPGGWYFEHYVDGDLAAPRHYGAPDTCVGCHAAGSDGLRTVALP